MKGADRRLVKLLSYPSRAFAVPLRKLSRCLPVPDIFIPKILSCLVLPMNILKICLAMRATISLNTSAFPFFDYVERAAIRTLFLQAIDSFDSF